MIWLDILILAIIAVSLALGFYRGIIAQIGSIGGVVLGVLACRLFTSVVAEKMCAVTSNPDPSSYLNTALACVVVFVVVFLIVKLLAKLMKSITHALCLGVADRLAGAVFKLFEWLLILSIALNVWALVSPESAVLHSTALAGGKALETIMALAPKLMGWAAVATP